MCIAFTPIKLVNFGQNSFFFHFQVKAIHVGVNCMIIQHLDWMTKTPVLKFILSTMCRLGKIPVYFIKQVLTCVHNISFQKFVASKRELPSA